MNLSGDISKEELEVFLEETDEQIKLLDEDLILLEKSGAKPEIIQEIFRAAHTLKGSSAMLGYEKMSNVAHAMETVLDKVRSGNLDITTPMINALLGGLDMLKVLREKLISKEDSSGVDIESINANLEKVAMKQAGLTASEKSTQSVTLNPEILQKIQGANDQGYNAHIIKIAIDTKSSWAAVRHFQVITELSQLGEIVTCKPSREDIESGKVGYSMEIILTSSLESPAINRAVKDVPEVSSIEVELFDIRTISPAVIKKEVSNPKTSNLTKPEPNIKSALRISPISETVRVDVKLLDNLINLIGEVIIDRNRIKQISRELAAKYEDDEIIEMLGDTSGHMAKLVTDLQDNILRVRMLHIGTILNGFPRLVRDLAQKANKKIEFIIEGQETELDRSIIEQIRDPLLHLLRNAVDHGIELPEKRKAAGKKETGTIRLSAYHEQSHILVCVSDDGGGIDVGKIKQVAVKKGLISQEEVDRLSPIEAQNLIFTSGLSTAEQVNEVSGRGVGMDVVKTNVSSVGGSIAIENRLGQGVTFTLRLPLTLATIDGIQVASGGLTYVIPISNIVEILRLKTDQIQCVMGREVFRLRENVIQIIRLNQTFETETERKNISDEINVVVIKVGNNLSGLVVDKVMEPQESVVKSLGKYIGSVRGISGATIMGDGQVALILDTATIVNNVKNQV